MMVGRTQQVTEPLRRRSLITTVTGVGGTARRTSSSGSRFRSQADGVEGAGRGLGSGAPGPAASRMLLFGSWRPGPFTICPSLGCGARRAQLWRRCNTHSFNCTYTKKGEQWGTAADSGGPKVLSTCACPGRLCKAREQNKLIVLQGRSWPAALWGGSGGGTGL